MRRYDNVCNKCERGGFPCSHACFDWDVEVTIAADTGYWPGTRRPYTYDWELALSDSDPEPMQVQHQEYPEEDLWDKPGEMKGLEERDAVRCAAVEKAERHKVSLGLTAQHTAARSRRRKEREERRMRRRQGIKGSVTPSAPVLTSKTSDTPKSRKAARKERGLRNERRSGRSGRRRRR